MSEGRREDGRERGAKKGGKKKGREGERDELCMLVHTCKPGNLIQEAHKSEISLDYQVSVRHKTRSYGDVEL